MQSNPRGRIRQGVRGTHSNGRVIRDGSIPPSTLECISGPFSFSHFEGLRLRSYVLALDTASKTVDGRGGGRGPRSVTPVPIGSNERERARREISHRNPRFLGIRVSRSDDGTTDDVAATGTGDRAKYRFPRESVVGFRMARGFPAVPALIIFPRFRESSRADGAGQSQRRPLLPDDRASRGYGE